MEYLTIDNVLAVVGAVVLVANTVVVLIDQFTDIKPSDSADAFASRTRKIVARVEGVIEKLSTYKAKP